MCFSFIFNLVYQIKKLSIIIIITIINKNHYVNKEYLISCLI